MSEEFTTPNAKLEALRFEIALPSPAKFKKTSTFTGILMMVPP